MKRDNRRVIYITMIIVVWVIMFAKHCRADDYIVWTDFFKLDEIELVYPGSFTSDHKNQCNPWCAYEKNGGHGFRIGIFGYISLTNSFKDPGSVRYIEAYDFEINYEVTELEFFKAVKFGLPIWIMYIDGYFYEERTDEYYVDSSGETKNVKTYEPITVGPVPWVVEQVAVNPTFIVEKLTGWRLYRHGEAIWIKYNIIHFPVVRIQWWSVEFNYVF